MKAENESGGNEAEFAPTLTNFAGTPEAYVDLISERWNWSYGTMFVTEMTDSWMKLYWEVKLVTGGWSENEEVVEQIRESMFHLLFWESIHRGGMHVFHVPSARWREHIDLGRWLKP